MSGAVWANDSFLSDPHHLKYVREIVDMHRPQIDVVWNGGIDPFVNSGSQISGLHWSRQFEWPWALAAADLSHRDMVLDAGAGDAPFQFFLSRRCRAVVNYDYSQAALDRAELAARQTG